MAEVFESSALYCLHVLSGNSRKGAAQDLYDSHLYYGELTKALAQLVDEIYPCLPDRATQSEFVKLYILHLCAREGTSKILDYLHRSNAFSGDRHTKFVTAFVVALKGKNVDYVELSRIWNTSDERERVLTSYCLQSYRVRVMSILCRAYLSLPGSFLKKVLLVENDSLETVLGDLLDDLSSRKQEDGSWKLRPFYLQ